MFRLLLWQTTLKTFVLFLKKRGITRTPASEAGREGRRVDGRRAGRKVGEGELGVR